MRCFKGLASLLVIFLLLFNIALASADLSSEPQIYSPTSTSSRAFSIPPLAVQNIISNMVDNVSTPSLQTYLNTLVNFGSRLYRAPGMFNASIWLHDVLKGTGRLVPSYHNFTVVRPTWGTFVLSNVILTLPGLNTSSDRVYYMYAHSDAVQFTNSSQWLNNTPGADDDGSGCTAVLEAARILSQYEFQDTIKFAFFNAEEIGLVGSGEYAQKISAQGENVQGGIDYDMIGYSTGTTANDLKLRYNTASRTQGIHMKGINSRYDVGLSLNVLESNSYIPSDISSFYAYNFPSVFGHEEQFSPYYHSTNDLVKYINFTLINKCTKLAVASLAEMARLLYTDVGVPSGELTVSNSNPLITENVTVNLNITNIGNWASEDLEVAFYLDGNYLESNRLTVPEFATKSTNITWPAVLGEHNISVILDPLDKIEELDETNNTAYLTIDVNDRPTAIITAVPMSISTNEKITFDGSLSHDLRGGITDYFITFGDGNSTGWQEATSAEYIYPFDGSYNASLMVRDSYGIESKSMNITVTVLNRPPSANPTSNLTRTYTFVPIQFYSNAIDIDGSVESTWYFANTLPIIAENPVHSFPKSGVYDVSLDIIDDDSASASYSMRIIIDNRAPECTIDAIVLEGDINTKFNFKAIATDLDGTITGYYWDFGNGFNSGTEQIEHSFSIPGTYKVRLLVVDDERAEARAEVTVTVNDLPPVAVASVVPVEVLTFENLYFNSNGSYDLEGAITYLWDFGDGNTSSAISPVHSYSIPKIYQATLTVQDLIGQTDSYELPAITIINRGPLAAFRVFGNLTENKIVYFDGSASYDVEGEIDYYWDFGDGTTGTGVMVEHVYSRSGGYPVQLKVRDRNWLTDTSQQMIVIKSTPLIISDPVGDKNETGLKPTEPSGGPGGNDNSWAVSLLMGLNILWIILLILILFMYLRRRRSSDDSKLSSVTEPSLQAVSPAPTALPVKSQDVLGASMSLAPLAIPHASTKTSQPEVQLKPITDLPALPAANSTPTTKQMDPTVDESVRSEQDPSI
jgi:PKD repeat protein